MKNLADHYGAENLIVVFGINQPATIRIMAQTFKSGDPGFSGPLAGVALGMASYHILELQSHIPGEVWEQEMGMVELEVEDEARAALTGTMEEIRSS